MADGIQVRDAALEITPDGLQALVNQQGASVRITKLDVAVSPEALSTLLAKFAPPEAAASAQVSDGRLQLSGQHQGKAMSLDLRAGSLRLEFTPEGLRLVTG